VKEDIRYDDTQIIELLMSFNSFRKHLYRFFDKKDFEDSKGMQQTLNKKVLELFGKYGRKNECRNVEFFFYTDALDKANNLAIELSAMQYEIYDVIKIDDDSYSISGSTGQLKMDEASLMDWSEQMCTLGYNHDCQFDGWGTLVE
jgi:regulator of RNase E activity RraB